jgi:Dockerin type I repeat.
MNLKRLSAALLAGVMMIGSAVSASAEELKVIMEDKKTGEQFTLESYLNGKRLEKDKKGITSSGYYSNDITITNDEVVYVYRLYVTADKRLYDNVLSNTGFVFYLYDPKDDTEPVTINYTVEESLNYLDGTVDTSGQEGKVVLGPPIKISILGKPKWENSISVPMLCNTPKAVSTKENELTYQDEVVFKIKKDERFNYYIKDPNAKKGDANGDGQIDVTDIAVAASHIKGIKPLNSKGIKNCDVNNDGTVDVTDIAMIASHIKGIKALA